MHILNSKILALLTMFVCSFCSFALVCSTELTFTDEGGVRVVLEITVPDKAAGILRGFLLNASDGLHQGALDEEAVRRAFLEADGFWMLEEYNVYTMRDARRVRIQATANDAVKALNDNGLLKGVMLKVENGERHLNVTMPVPKTWNAERAAAARMLMEMLDGLEVILIVQTPDTMFDATGTRESLERCRWHMGPEAFLQNTMPEIRASWWGVPLPNAAPQSE